MPHSFRELDLAQPILRALSEREYETPTPIQAQAIPPLMSGRDLLGIAQTGTGKTAAFALPILDFLANDPQPPVSRRPSVLVLTPTRELASQIASSFEVYGRYLKLKTTVVFGGVGQGPQVSALKRGIDVLVATPGRLLDLMDQGHVSLRDIEVFCLDEADRMLDMGFIHAVRRIVAKLPEDRQSLLFSATMPPDIVKLAHSMLRDPLRVEVTPPATTVERIDQSILLVEKTDKRKLLIEILDDDDFERVLVFTRAKYGADRVVRELKKKGIAAAAIHGNKTQRTRERALEGFRSGEVRVLVATDIAARGIDVPEISHVINFDLPNIPESYVHRIGRTARAGRDGIAMSFCDIDEREFLFDIEKAIGQEVPIVEEHAYRSTVPFSRPAPGAKRPKKKKKKQQQNSGGRGRGRGPSSNKPRRSGAARSPARSGGGRGRGRGAKSGGGGGSRRD